MARVEFVVTLIDIEEDACHEVLRQGVEKSLAMHLPFITAEVVCADQ